MFEELLLDADWSDIDTDRARVLPVVQVFEELLLDADWSDIVTNRTRVLPVVQVFEELLLDADWSVNAGTWMWLSCSSFFQQFFHCYSPVRFGRKVDPEGDYIRLVTRGGVTGLFHEVFTVKRSQKSGAKVTGILAGSQGIERRPLTGIPSIPREDCITDCIAFD